MPRRLYPAVFLCLFPLIAASWWLLPRPTPAAERPVRPSRPAEAPFGVWRGIYSMRPAGLWDELGTLEVRVTRQVVEDNPASRSYRVEARLRSSRYGMLDAEGVLRQYKGQPQLGWVLQPVRSRVVPGLGAFEVSLLPEAVWNGASATAPLALRTGLGAKDGSLRYALEAPTALDRRPGMLVRPQYDRRLEVRVERAQMPPSDLRKAIENLAAPGTPEAAQPLPPRAEESAVTVRLLDKAGKPVAGERVRISVHPAPESGGHAGPHSGDRPHGWLLAADAAPPVPGGPRIGSVEPELVLRTDKAGEIRLRYRAPELGAVETLAADLPRRPEVRAFVELRVGLPLVALPPNPDYFLVGGTVSHPSPDGEAGTNHFVSPAVLPKLAALAADFHRATGLPLRINDSSLAWGGVFDIDGGWERPHYNHRDGTDVDIAIFNYGPDGRALTAEEVELLAGMIRRHGGRPGHEGDHIHASFGTVRYAEGPPRPKPALPAEEPMDPELLKLLERLDTLLEETSATPEAPAKAGAGKPATKPAPAPKTVAPGQPAKKAAPVKTAAPAAAAQPKAPAPSAPGTPPAPEKERPETPEPAPASTPAPSADPDGPKGAGEESPPATPAPAAPPQEKPATPEPPKPSDEVTE